VIFVDSNVVIDILGNDPAWFDWSFRQLSLAVRTSGAFANLIVLAECAPRFDSAQEELDAFATLGIALVELEAGSAFAAGHMFRRYRQAPDRGKILADFLIGAHALELGATLLTRDRRIYDQYFPNLPLITPDTDNG